MTLSMLRRLALAGMVALLLGIVPSAQLAEAGQDPSLWRSGKFGVSENIEELRADAEAGDVETQYILGLMYGTGRGVPQDPVEAVAWFRQAAEQGFAQAQYTLGRVYYNGEVVPQDFVEAYLWASVATTYADGTMRDVHAESRDEIAERLTPEQRAEGQKRAREWFEAHPR